MWSQSRQHAVKGEGSEQRNRNGSMKQTVWALLTATSWRWAPWGIHNWTRRSKTEQRMEKNWRSEVLVYRLERWQSCCELLLVTRFCFSITRFCLRKRTRDEGGLDRANTIGRPVSRYPSCGWWQWSFSPAVQQTKFSWMEALSIVLNNLKNKI